MVKYVLDVVIELNAIFQSASSSTCSRMLSNTALGSIGYHRRSRSVGISDILKSNRYIVNTVEAQVEPLRHTFLRAVFQHDNARHHVARTFYQHAHRTVFHHIFNLYIYEIYHPLNMPRISLVVSSLMTPLLRGISGLG